MGNFSQFTTVLFIAVLAVSGLLLVGSVSAQSYSKPSVPEFTVQVLDHSFTVPANTTEIYSSFFGGAMTVTPGVFKVNGTIEITIKNLPFTPYFDANGNQLDLFYCVRVQGDDAIYWSYYPSVDCYFPASNYTYTKATVEYFENCYKTGGGFSTLRPDGTLDVQVQAFVGYMNVTYVPSGCVVIRQEDYRTEWVGQTSDWSSTQTAIIPNGAYTPTTPYPLPSTSQVTPYTSTNQATPSPSENQQIINNPSLLVLVPLTTLLLIIAVLVGVIVVLLVILLTRNQKTANLEQ